MKKLLLLFGCLFALGACKKQEIKDDELLQAYIEDHNLTATKTDEGLYYIISTVGTGIQPAAGSTINISYEGLLLNGNVFDSGSFEAPLSNLISGFQIGMPYFREGGSGILLIPSGLAYGKAGAPPSIPANSPLVFNITLNDVL